MTSITLECTSTLLSDYFKALGIFRIIAEQSDSNITAYWRYDKFVLETDMSEDEILEFILKQYKPTPIITPWSYNKYLKTKASIKEIKDDRFESYHTVIQKIDEIIEIFCKILNLNEMKKEAIKTKTKPLFLQICRNNFPDKALSWLDVNVVLDGMDAKFAPITASGGNDGNFDMAENFVNYLIEMLDHSEESKNLLRQSLFGGSIELNKTESMIGHNPDGNSSATSGQSFESKPISNKWDYILMLEGIISFAGNLSRRQSHGKGKAVFPFTTDGSHVGYATASDDERKIRGEIWLPIWNNPATYREITYVFSEGRVQLDGKQAGTGTEFARAVVSLGVERGISAFQRFSIVQRKGDAYYYINAGKVRTANESNVYLLSELDNWYNPIYQFSQSKKSSASIKRHVRNFENEVMEFCKYGKKEHLLKIMILVGKIERQALLSKELNPLQELSAQWIEKSYDNTVEFRLAASIASIKSDNSVGGIRENLEDIQYKKRVEHKKDSTTSVVWKEDDGLLKNMNRVLQRRGIDGKIKSLDTIPIKGIIPARMDDIVKFLRGEVDMRKINDLVLPLSMVSINQETKYPWKHMKSDIYDMPIPEAYMIMKLIFPPDKDEKIPYDTSILNMLYAERFDDAYAKAAYILHSHMLSPLKYSKINGMSKTLISDVIKKHIMASLLFPISKYDRHTMLRMVTVKQNT